MDAEPALVAGVLREVSESFLDYAVAAVRQKELRQDMRATAPVVATLPFLDGDIVDLEGLGRVADLLRA
jgi:hypothetical protein